MKQPKTCDFIFTAEDTGSVVCGQPATYWVRDGDPTSDHDEKTPACESCAMRVKDEYEIEKMK